MVKEKKEKRESPLKSPLGMFFNLAPKDPIMRALFDYCLMWIIFLGFGYMFLNHMYIFFKYFIFSNLSWGLVTGGILYFNYSALVGMRAKYQLVKRMHTEQPNASIDANMAAYDEPKAKTNKKGGKNERINKKG